MLEMKRQRQIEELWGYVYTSGIGDVEQGLIVVSHLFIVKQYELLALDDESSSWWQAVKAMAQDDGPKALAHLRGPVSQWLYTHYPESFLRHATAIFARLAPQKILPLMQAIDFLCEGLPMLGEVYEGILDWAALQGIHSSRTGQVMTPRHIAHLMADALCPKPGDRIVDLSCGTGNLLVAALRSMAANSQGDVTGQSALTGYDIDFTMEVVGWTHLFLWGVESPNIMRCDTLGSSFNGLLSGGSVGKQDIILANPPYSGVLDVADLGESLQWLGTQQTELLFVELAMQCLGNSGRVALLLPDGVVRNSSAQALAIRRKLVTEHCIRIVVSLPAGVFLPYANIKTSLIFLEKGGSVTSDLWFYSVEADGYAFNAKRMPTLERNDLWDLRCVLALLMGHEQLPYWAKEYLSEDLWQQYKEGEASAWYVAPIVSGGQVVSLQLQPARKQKTWQVSVEQIAAKKYSLCAESYRPE